MDLSSKKVAGRTSASIGGMLSEEAPQGVRKSLRVVKAASSRVVSPYFARKSAAGGQSGERRVAVPSKKKVLKESTKVEEHTIAPQSIFVRDNYRQLGADFFNCDALELAPKLLGKLLCRDDVVLQITEVVFSATHHIDLTDHKYVCSQQPVLHELSQYAGSQGCFLISSKVEAYRPEDTACHGRFGQTARTEAMFRSGGHAYVYLCYGINIMLNVVADKVGVGAAVLIRACSPVAGLPTILLRRKQNTVKPVLLTGPGKVGQALGLTTEWSCHPLYLPGGLEILDAPLPDAILSGPRVGIDYAAPHDVSALWRFAIAGTPWVSAPRTTLLPIYPPLDLC